MKTFKKLIACLGLLLCSASALALTPYEIVLYQTDPTGAFVIGRILYQPAGDAMFMYDRTTNVPMYGLVGSGLNWDGTTLTATSNGTVSSITCGAGLSGGTITTTGTCSMANIGSAGSYSGVTTDAQGRITSGTNRAFNHTTRALNTCFQLSSTRDALVSYAVDIATSLSLTTGAQGTVYLRTYTNSGCTTGTQEVIRGTNGQTGTLTIGLALSQPVTAHLSGVVPAGTFVQLVTELNVGTPTFTARPGQEVLL